MAYSITNAGLTFPKTRTKRTKTEGILLHHPDAQWTVWQTHDYHTNTKGWNGIGYNFYIHKNGTIYEGRGQNYVGAHCTNYNSKTIGISCQGQYDSVDTSMPDTQFNALIWLIEYLKGIYGSGIYVKGHKDVASTACPGRYFPLSEVQAGQYRGTVTTNTTDENGCPYTEPTANLSKGSSGDGVRWIQWYLTELGYNIGSIGIDGSFGTNTDSAVKIFQSLSGLTVDGIVGSNTRSALKTAYANKDNTTTEEVIEDMTEAETRALIKELVPSIAKTAITDYLTELSNKEVSDWAKIIWKDMTTLGVFDGEEPQMYVTREQNAKTLSLLGDGAFQYFANVEDCDEWMQPEVKALIADGFLQGTDENTEVGKYKYDLQAMIVAYRMYLDAVSRLTAESE